MEQAEREALIVQTRNLVELIRREVFGKYDELVSPNWKTIYRLAKNHSVFGCIGNAVQETDCPDEIKRSFLQQGARVLKRQILFDDEREKIFAEYDKAKVKYLQLKGKYFCDLYPNYGMREFADNDILVEPFDKKINDNVFLPLGYHLEAEGSVHHAYQKEPIFDFEMHKGLFADYMTKFSYFDDVMDRVVRVDENRYEYRMTNEDQYLFALAHMFKHDKAGTGLRGYLDFILLNRSLKEKLDRSFVENMLEKMELAEFERESISISEQLYDGERCTLGEDELFYLACGYVYGTAEHRIEKQVKEKGKKAYWEKLFLPYSLVSSSYPIIKKFPILYPFFHIYRFIVVLFDGKRRKSAMKQLKYYKEKMKEQK